MESPLAFETHDSLDRLSLPLGRRSLRFIADLAAIAGFVTLPTSVALAQAQPHGGEIQVNNFTTSAQRWPAVAADSQGRFVVVWDSLGPDGSNSSVQGRRFSADGVPLGPEFQVNSFTTDYQRSADIATSGAGQFMVVWTSNLQDGSAFGIRGRVFDAGGSPLGPDFAVNSHTTDSQEDPAVTSDGQGNFIVVWHSMGQDGSGRSVHARRFDSSGANLGAEFQANTYTTGNQERPDVASDTGGNFVITWQSDQSNGPDTSLASSLVRYFDANGNPSLGPEFVVNTYTYDNQVFPAIAADDQDRFVVVWQSDGSQYSDHFASSIQGQLLDFQGGLGDEFQVNSYTTGGQFAPAVAAFASLSYVVSWNSDLPSGTDPSRGIVGRCFCGGNADEFHVNTFTTGDQDLPAIAADDDGNFVIVWQSYGSSGSDNDSASIQAQFYDALFRDGFDSGGTSRWSAALP